jgi:hypothetical protein
MMIAAAAALGMASSAAAAESPACYDAAVVGWLTDSANPRLVDVPPLLANGLTTRVQADVRVTVRSQIAGAELPRTFWARATMVSPPVVTDTMLIYLKNQPDGVPVIVDYRYAPAWYRQVQLTDYPAC